MGTFRLRRKTRFLEVFYLGEKRGFCRFEACGPGCFLKSGVTAFYNLPQARGDFGELFPVRRVGGGVNAIFTAGKGGVLKFLSTDRLQDLKFGKSYRTCFGRFAKIDLYAVGRWCAMCGGPSQPFYICSSFCAGGLPDYVGGWGSAAVIGLQFLQFLVTGRKTTKNLKQACLNKSEVFEWFLGLVFDRFKIDRGRLVEKPPKTWITLVHFQLVFWWFFDR